MMNKLSMISATLFVLIASAAHAAVTVNRKPVDMNFDEHRYNMDVYSEAGLAKDAKRPALILVPEYWGKDELAAAHAKTLAEKGYVVMVLDLYGDGRHSKKAAVADELQEAAEEHGLDKQLDLIANAINLLKDQPNVDKSRIGGVGLGYGGGLLFNLAKRGNSDLSALVSFYGGTAKLRETSQLGKLPELLYIHPEYDNYTTKEDYQAFKNDLLRTNFKFEAMELKDAHFGFINKGIEDYGKDGGNMFMFYDQKAANAAWGKTFEFLDKNMKVAASNAKPANQVASSKEATTSR